MAPLIYLDTHVVAWLFLGDLQRIPKAAQKAINNNELLISPMVLVELQYLFEVGRTAETSERVFESLDVELGLKVCDLPFPQVARRAFDVSWTRDPFDRLIVSQASLREAKLVTKDREIHRYYSAAVWSDPA